MCGEICDWKRSDGTFQPKKNPTLPKELIDKLASRRHGAQPPEQFSPAVEPKLTAQDISGIQPLYATKPFAPKFVPILPGTIRSVRDFGTESLPPVTEEDLARILDTVYDHAAYKKYNVVAPQPVPCNVPKRCLPQKTENRLKFVFGYMRELIRYIRTTTAVHYVPAETVSPNVSHKMVTFVGTKINKLIATDPNLLGNRHHDKVRLYKKLYIPLVIAARHRDELMRTRVAYTTVQKKYSDIMKRLDKRATVGVELSVPEINRDILTYIERYGMPEEFLFDPQLMQSIKNEAMD